MGDDVFGRRCSGGLLGRWAEDVGAGPAAGEGGAAGVAIVAFATAGAGGFSGSSISGTGAAATLETAGATGVGIGVTTELSGRGAGAGSTEGGCAAARVGAAAEVVESSAVLGRAPLATTPTMDARVTTTATARNVRGLVPPIVGRAVFSVALSVIGSRSEGGRTVGTTMRAVSRCTPDLLPGSGLTLGPDSAGWRGPR